MTQLDPKQDVITLINVFTVAPDRQQQLVEVLVQATQEVIRHLPGYVSANIHASLDGKHVANYAQWESEEAFQAMLQDQQSRQHREAASAIAQAEPVLYRLVHSDHR